MNSHYMQFALATILVLMLGALTDPFMYWMPSVPAMLALTLSCVCLALWMGLAAREGAVDEREGEHRMFAGRVAYLAGVGILTIALCMQGLAHAIDPWVPSALAAMVVSKIAARWYADTFW